MKLIESDSADSIDSRTPARDSVPFLASVTNSIGLDERDRDEILLNLKKSFRRLLDLLQSKPQV